MLFVIFFINCYLTCSDFQLKTDDGSIICGRAMDFILPMESQIRVFKRGMNMSSKAPDGSIGLQWTSKYGFVGINAFGVNLIDEGMNEQGLTCGFLVLNETIYPYVTKNYYNISIAIMDVCNWILGSFSNTKEIIDNIFSVSIWGNVMPPPINIVIGCHIAIHDARGRNLVIEFLDGRLYLAANPLGVLTNDPPLDYHLNNLILYNGLSPYTPKSIDINGFKVSGVGASGMQGIPGSWSSIDRFVRVATMVRYLDNLKTAMDGVLAATYILNSVYVAPGMAIGAFKGYKLIDTTRWSTMKDLTNLVFYYRNGDGAIRAVYLKKLDFDVDHKPYSVQQPQPLISDVTPFL
jgi:choloylglycine hydrolase